MAKNPCGVFWRASWDCARPALGYGVGSNPCHSRADTGIDLARQNNAVRVCLAREVENIGLAGILGSVIRRSRTWKQPYDRNGDLPKSDSDTNFNTNRRRHKSTDGSSISRRITCLLTLRRSGSAPGSMSQHPPLSRFLLYQYPRELLLPIFLHPRTQKNAAFLNISRILA
jgi:hypothetical protein